MGSSSYQCLRAITRLTDAVVVQLTKRVEEPVAGDAAELARANCHLSVWTAQNLASIARIQTMAVTIDEG